MKILHRKGHINDIKNYRPINLVSNIYKLFSKVMINRLESVLDSNQPKKKVGFRTIFSTIDNIHTINQLKEKCLEHNILFSMAFVDYEKAFDSVETHSVLEALREQGINSNYIKLMRDIYTDNSTTVFLQKDSKKNKEEYPTRRHHVTKVIHSLLAEIL